MVRKLPVYTNSEIKAWQKCQRYHHYKYRLMARPRERAEALRRGSLMHLGLEAWYNAIPGHRLDFALVAIKKNSSDPFEHAWATSMLLGYDARWGDQKLEIVGVEIEFSFPVSDTALVAGKIDAIVADEDGRKLAVEHKTSSEDISEGSSYWQALRLDSQVTTYSIASPVIEGVLYDVLKKPQAKPLLATPVEKRKYTKKTGELYANQRECDETPDEYQARLLNEIGSDPDAYYKRGVVVRLEDEIRDGFFDLQALIQEIQIADRACAHHPKNPASCRQYGRLCEYFRVCTGEDHLQSDRFYVADRKHEELNDDAIANVTE